VVESRHPQLGKTVDLSDKPEVLVSFAFVSSCLGTQGMRKHVRPGNHVGHGRISGGK
jgi:hypothetical protein